MSMNKNHLVFHPYPTWSHTKPVVVLAALILEARPDIIFTLLTDSAVYAKFVNELSLKLSPSRYEAISSRLNVIDVSGNPANVFIGLPEFDPAFEALYSLQPVTCKSSGRTYDGLPRPTVAVIDPFASYAYEKIRAVSKRQLPILAWIVAPAGAITSVFGPHHLGGPVEPELETAAGRIRAKEALATYAQKTHSSTGKVHEVPGIPPMYDYEFMPQDVPFPQTNIERRGQIYIREVDGMVCISSSAFEEESIDAAKQWYNSLGKTFYALGPLSLPNARATEMTETEQTTIAFLDRMQIRFGNKSLLYISFGTMFWPLEPEKLWALLEELIASQTPFILSNASMFASLTEDKKKAISDSEIGLSCQWAPQEIILSHPVTGWFVTHGGWNSMQEAFIARVPLIFWPFYADQPFNAARMTLSHQAAFELIEVRTGKQGRVPYRCKDGLYPTYTVDAAREEVRSLLTRIKGDEGQQVRERYEVVCEGMATAWDEGHETRRDFEAFLAKYFA